MKVNHYLTTATCAGLIVSLNFLAGSPSEANKFKKSNSFPTSGKVLKLTNGDLMCYVEINTSGKIYQLGADFDICNQTKLLNQQVRLTYQRIKVNDCQSIEPCGKTKLKNLIVKMKLIPQR
ncbi:MAG: hypothetical protein LH474_11885 [Chamaesiphon sp.]|nr:hypothetical protein [Chamaesiphon sp.]